MSNQESLQNLPLPGDAQQAKSICRKALVSFELSLLSFLVSILAGIPAIINGLLGLREIRQSRGRLQGKGLAVSGILLGSLGSLASGSLIMYGVASVQRAVQRTGMG
jgi:hypothetical protein